MISIINLFSLEQHVGPYEEWPTKTKLFINDKYTGTQLVGYVIDAQYSVEDHYLLILSMDCIFEESNTIFLLNNSFEIIAHANIPEEFSVLPGSYLLNECKIISDKELILKYQDSISFRLEINLKSKGIFNKKLKFTSL
jgi:hypothetical protein